MNSDMDGDMENQVELEEKTRLINQVLELQNTLEDLSARVDAVKEENLKLKSENQQTEGFQRCTEGEIRPLGICSFWLRSVSSILEADGAL
ncbi:hypothetical protein AOLI_G00065250 [Acnodon oligacanthus]